MRGAPVAGERRPPDVPPGMHPWQKGDRGSASLVVVGALGVAVILAGLAVDVARVARARTAAQTGADAAALAAAQELVVPTGRAPPEVAAEYAERNGTALVACRCDPSGGEAVVTVEVVVTLPALRTTRRVRASARAVVEGAFSAPSSGAGSVG